MEVITRLTKEKYGLLLDGNTKKFGDNMILLPFDYLCAKELSTGELHITNHTYTIHHFTSSWLPEADRKYKELYQRYYHTMKQSGVPEKVAFYGSRVRAVVELQGLCGLLKKIAKR